MKTVLVILGGVSLALGVVGIFVPLLPTTPFLLLAAALWLRSSSRLHARLLTHPYLGPYIRNYNENRAIPLRAKILSVALLWTTILYCLFGFALPRWAQAVLIAVLVGVTWHILHFKTLRR